ncbi:MAG: IS3 family transposase, partial [Reyranellaceae bacterium]
RRHYNTIRPHISLGNRPPAPETILPPSWPPGSATHRRLPGLAEMPPVH